MSVLKLVKVKSHSHKKLDSAGWGKKKHALFTLAVNVLKRHFPDTELIFTRFGFAAWWQ